MKIYILNFSNTRDSADVIYFFEQHGGRTNIDFLEEDFSIGTTNWSVPKSASPGDIAVFMCAASAYSNFSAAASHISGRISHGLRSFIDREKALYKKYSGHLLGFGFIKSDPEYDAELHWTMDDIGSLRRFEHPVPLSCFRDFIKINSRGSVTSISHDQWERLRLVINQRNPGFFTDTIALDAGAIQAEFEKAVQDEATKPLEQLADEAARKASVPARSIVQTSVYHRDPTIAAYVRERAAGRCQLCGEMAPFLDKEGHPYLECHHIEWLSKGGADSPDNCAALCPNCHRKMHVVNSEDDRQFLSSVIAGSNR